MCRNHSHLIGEIESLQQIGLMYLLTVTLTADLTVELPSGARLTLPQSAILSAQWLITEMPASSDIAPMEEPTTYVSVAGATA